MPVTGVSGPVCRVCGGVQAKPLVQKDGYDFAECDACGFVFLDPMPDQTTLNEIYEDQAVIAGGDFPKARSRMQRAYGRAVWLWPYTFRKKVLDIGCGGGFIVGAMAALGAEGHGFDVDETAIAYARQRFPKCRFMTSSFQDFQSHGDQYDFVYSSEVIEHVAELSTFMELLHRVTRPGGHVYITTPDLGSPRRPDDLLDWDVFSPPIHVQFFDENMLTSLFGKHGFIRVRKYHDSKIGLKMLFRRA